MDSGGRDGQIADRFDEPGSYLNVHFFWRAR